MFHLPCVRALSVGYREEKVEICTYAHEANMSWGGAAWGYGWNAMHTECTEGQPRIQSETITSRPRF